VKHQEDADSQEELEKCVAKILNAEYVDVVMKKGQLQHKEL
jgi:hypothetical protein